MRLGNSLIGNPVFGSSDGRKLGGVKDLYLDDDLRSVVGIYLGREGLLRPTPRFVERKDIALFGMDALLAKSSFTVYEGDEAPEPPGWLRLDQLQGREVRTPGGTRIGKVEDVILDEDAHIVGFSLTNLSVKGPVAEADAVARRVLVDAEDEDGRMTIDLAQAEQALLEVDPSLLFAPRTPSKPAVAPEITETPEMADIPEAEEQPEAFEQSEAEADS